MAASSAASRSCGRSPATRRRRGARAGASSRAALQRPSATCSPAPWPARTTSACASAGSCTAGSPLARRCARTARATCASARSASAGPAAASQRSASATAPARRRRPSPARSSRAPAEAPAPTGRGAAVAQSPALRRAERREHEHVRRRCVGGRRARRSGRQRGRAPTGTRTARSGMRAPPSQRGTRRPRQSPRPSLIAYFEACVGTTGFSIEPSCSTSFVHCCGLRIACSRWLPSRSPTGWKPTWMWSA